MQTLFRTLAIGLISIAGGGVVGYLLFVPIFVIPMDFGVSILHPMVRDIHQYFSSRGFDQVAGALAAFVLRLPNTIALTLASAVALRSLPIYRRMAIYSVFAFPMWVHLEYWLEVWLLKRGAAQLGLSTSIDQLPTNVHIEALATLIFLTYTFFLASLLVSLRLRAKKTCAAPVFRSTSI